MAASLLKPALDPQAQLDNCVSLPDLSEARKWHPRHGSIPRSNMMRLVPRAGLHLSACQA
eukprot:14675403-Alexandrium_andersonii.AAC.1